MQQLLSKQRTLYNLKWINNYSLPEKIRVAKKGTNDLEDRVVYHKYDILLGNALDVSKAGKNGSEGTHISYIWGYNKTLPIAKLENIKYDDISAILISQVQDASNDDSKFNSNFTTENTLRASLQDLRDAYPKAMISTYTYDPQIGLTSVTDPRGQTSFYEYDTFKRLKKIKDADKNIIQIYEYEYHNDL